MAFEAVICTAFLSLAVQPIQILQLYWISLFLWSSWTRSHSKVFTALQIRSAQSLPDPERKAQGLQQWEAVAQTLLITRIKKGHLPSLLVFSPKSVLNWNEAPGWISHTIALGQRREPPCCSALHLLQPLRNGSRGAAAERRLRFWGPGGFIAAC